MKWVVGSFRLDQLDTDRCDLEATAGGEDTGLKHEEETGQRAALGT
jgi:hypothetical protein